MSATFIPGRTSAISKMRRASPARSRIGSSEKRDAMILATGRSGSGKTGFLGARWQPARVVAAISRARLVDVFDIDLFPRYPLRQRRRHERIERPVEHVGRRRRGHPGAQVLDQLIGLENVAADLVAPAD